MAFRMDCCCHNSTDSLPRLSFSGRYIPSDLGYGDRGSPPKIPASSVLVFQMEIVEIQGDEKDLAPALKCNPTTKEECNDKEVSYIAKILVWDEDKRKTEIARLQKMMGGKSSPDLVDWMNRRWNILQQLVSPRPTETGDKKDEGSEL